MRILVALSFLTLLGIYAAKAEMLGTPQGGTENDILPTYLKEEAVRIFNEGDRIKGEAERLRSESARLNSEGQRLRTNAALLDALWLDEDHLWHLGRYSGYNRSQVRMRSDAVKLDYDANVLRDGAQSLDYEAVRLWKLSGEVDPAAMNAILKRLRNCCNAKVGLRLLRAHIIQMAHAEHVHYVPQ